VSVLVDLVRGRALVGGISRERIKKDLLDKSNRKRLRKTLSSLLIKPKGKGSVRCRYV
jgi:hypothetical protein